MRNLLIGFAAVAVLFGCSKKAPPVSPELWMDVTCGRPPATMAAAGFNSDAELQTYMAQNHIVLVNDVPRPAMLAAIYDYRYRFPANANRYLAGKGIKLRLMWAQSVFDDPEFNEYHTKAFSADDRSRYKNRGGVAYMWGATILTNHLIQRGVNVVVHERAHNLDLLTLTETGKLLSDAPEWREAFNEPELKSVMKEYCGSHCETPIESFAEAHSMYHACPASRGLLKSAPKTLAYFKSLDERLR